VPAKFQHEALILFSIGLWVWLSASSANCAEESAIILPAGVQAVWDVGKAFHETTPTRERICLNGLWQWQPTDVPASPVPTNDWGYFKVPGCWPGITDYMQKDCQTVYAHPAWSNRKPGDVTKAW
jgi:beta-galactosidase